MKLCTLCKEREVIDNRCRYCEECRINVYREKKIQSNIKIIKFCKEKRNQRIIRCLCVICGNKRDNGFKCCSKCRKIIREKRSRIRKFS